MIKTELFYKLAVTDMEEALDTGMLGEIVTTTENMVDGKNVVDFKYKGAVDLSVFQPQKGFGVGHYQVKLSGDHEKSVSQALSDLIETSGLPTYTRGSDKLVKEVLKPRKKGLKIVFPLPRIREVVDL